MLGTRTAEVKPLYPAQPLADTTNINGDTRAVKNFWGTRFKSTADCTTPPTSRRQRPATPGTHAAARSAASETPTPSSAARSDAKGAAFHAYKPSPQRPLFQQFLLRDLRLEDEQSPNLTVVFDLDETLVSNRRADLPEALLRPYCVDALHAIRRLPNVEVVLWTASTEETGGPVVAQLQRHRGKLFDDVIFRNELWFTEPMHTKDLRLLGRNMDRVVVFDNAPSCVKLNRYNGVLVEDYHGRDDMSDETLVNIYRMIQSLLGGLESGSTVPEMLSKFAETSSLGCRTVQYNLPESWANVNLRNLSPVMIPPQGRFYKLSAERVV